MAPPAGTLRVGRYFLVLLGLFVVLFTIVFWPGTDHAPKLGLDLRGGAQVVYKAQTTTGKSPSRDSMNQAKSIIDQRVNGLGVEQSTVVIQGNDEIVVTVPGKRADQLSDVGKTALLNFRPLISGGYAATSATASPTATASTSGSAARIDPGVLAGGCLERALERRLGPERGREAAGRGIDHAARLECRELHRAGQHDPVREPQRESQCGGQCDAQRLVERDRAGARQHRARLRRPDRRAEGRDQQLQLRCARGRGRAEEHRRLRHR